MWEQFYLDHRLILLTGNSVDALKPAIKLDKGLAAYEVPRPTKYVKKQTVSS